MGRSSGFNEPITRVLSVRCNDTNLALCAQFLERLGLHMSTTSEIVKNVIAAVASQAERTGIQPMPLQQAREYLTERYGSAGITRNKHTYTEHAYTQGRQQYTENAILENSFSPHQSSTNNTNIPSGEAVTEYTNWLSANKLTWEQCPYPEYLERKKQEQAYETQRAVEAYAKKYVAPEACETFTRESLQTEKLPDDVDPNLPIAAKQSFDELTQLAAERAEREAAERRMMTELAKAQQQAFTTNEEA